MAHFDEQIVGELLALRLLVQRLAAFQALQIGIGNSHLDTMRDDLLETLSQHTVNAPGLSPERILERARAIIKQTLGDVRVETFLPSTGGTARPSTRARYQGGPF